MKYLNTNNVQVVVASATKNYYLPPKTACEISEEIAMLPKGVKVLVESTKSEPLNLTKSKEKDKSKENK